jgi:TolA-binding protein
LAVRSKTLLGMVQRDQDGDVAGAVVTLREAAAGGDPTANLTLGQTLNAAGDPHGAAKAFHRVVATHNADAPAAMLSLSGIALDEGDKDTARHWLTRLVDTFDPVLWPVAANSLGLLAKDRRDVPDALRWFGLLIDAGHADAALAAAHLGELRYLLGDTADAVRWYEYALAHTDDPQLVGEAACRVGEIYSQAGAHDRARPLLTRAVDSGFDPFAASAAALLASIAGIGQRSTT